MESEQKEQKDICLIPPFSMNRSPRSCSRDVGVNELHGQDSDISALIPSEVQDSYHFLNMVFIIRNAYFNVPKCMTLNRFRYLLNELCVCLDITHLKVLDPLYEGSKDEQFVALQSIDNDMYNHLNHTMVFCIGSSGSDIISLPMAPRDPIVPFCDKHLNTHTPHGYLEVVYRVFYPRSVSSDYLRVQYLRQIASCHSAISVRASLLLTDPMFPLFLVPGVLDRQTLESLAVEVPSIGSD